jgi:hypothetical protein
MSNHNESRRRFIKTTGIAAGIGITGLPSFVNAEPATLATSFTQQPLPYEYKALGACDRYHDDGDPLQ